MVMPAKDKIFYRGRDSMEGIIMDLFSLLFSSARLKMVITQHSVDSGSKPPPNSWRR